MNPTDYIDSDEGREFAASHACKNCDATSNLTDYWPDDEPRSILLCEDCAEEQARLEAKANQLSALPSCDYRLMVMDKAESVRQLVNHLEAHDLRCDCTRTAKKPAAIALVVVAPQVETVIEGGVA